MTKTRMVKWLSIFSHPWMNSSAAESFPISVRTTIFYTVFSLIIMCQYCSINSGVNLSFVLQQMKMTTKWSRCCLTFLWSLSACSPRSCVSAPCTELTISGWLVFSSKGLWYISFLLVQFTKHIEVLLLANQGIYFATFFLAHLMSASEFFRCFVVCDCQSIYRVSMSQYLVRWYSTPEALGLSLGWDLTFHTLLHVS